MGFLHKFHEIKKFQKFKSFWETLSLEFGEFPVDFLSSIEECAMISFLKMTNFKLPKEIEKVLPTNLPSILCDFTQL